MKILVDQNISHRLLPKIASKYPDVYHTKDLGLTDYDDYKIFQYACQNKFDCVLTLDEDFNNLLIQHGIPPKVVWLRVGNCSTRVLAEIMLEKEPVIRAFLDDLESECLQIFS
ncbi:MAG: DUF5615 family PIN-like protein [Bacteroidota bacterium]